MGTADSLLRTLCFGPAPARERRTALESTATDTELAQWARQGDNEAIAHLVDRYSHRLYRYLLRLVGDTALAEDLLQDTWLRVMERLDRYNPKHPFAVWLFVVARNCAIDALRRRARMEQRAEPRQRVEGPPVDVIEQLPDGAASLLDRLAEQDLHERVLSVFSALPLRYREVLTLRFHQELRIREIAQVLRIPLSTVKTRLDRGLALLRQRVEGMGWVSHE